MLSTLLNITFTVFACMAIILFRNRLVFHIRMRAIDTIAAMNRRDVIITFKDYVELPIDIQNQLADEMSKLKQALDEQLEVRWNLLHEPSYVSQLFDLTRWTFKSFYPQLFEEAELPCV